MKEKKRELFQKKHFLRNYKIGIISGYIDAEGKITGKREICISARKRHLDLIRKFARSVGGIKTSKIERTKVKGKIKWRLTLSDFKGLRHLSSRIRRSYREKQK